MNKTELKNFAIQSRRQLIDQVKTKALMYGIDEKNELEIQEQFGQLMINDKPYPLYMKPAFNSLKNQLRQKGYKQLVEEVAYTWFNRIIAIRYMEVHDYLPEKVNVLSSSVGRVDPDILFEYETMDLPVKQEEIRELLHAGDTESAYRKLFIAQCNALNSILPFLFEQIQDYTELLLPDFLLDAESVIKVLVQNDELTNSFEEIEVIGWLYQYYIVEEKNRVFAQKSKYKKEEIPFATQLFTPKWIVQYMVQNSLGRYWTEGHREDEDLISNWEYFIKHEDEDFHEKIAPYVNKELRVEDIKLLDPAMGSGHILVYAFEIFHQIYEKCGYPEREIPRLIIENNLYGLDIDDRAYQLATFAVVMKAASYSRRFLRSIEREGIQLNLVSIQETNHISDSVITYIAQEEVGERYNQVKAFFDQYINAKIYGSLINITERDISFIEERLEYIQNNPAEDLFLASQHSISTEVLPALVRQTKIMWNKYDVVVMNPPYMGNSAMNDNLNKYLQENYPNTKSDMSTAMMEKIEYFSKNNALMGLINIPSWMFLSSYEIYRKKLLDNLTICSLLHLGRGIFGSDFGTVATILRNSKINNFKGIYIKFIDKQGEVDSISEKERKFFDKKRVIITEQEKFYQIPGNPIAFWASEVDYNNFLKNKSIREIALIKKGLDTGKNEAVLRKWFEVKFHDISFDSQNREEFDKSGKVYAPFNKGGEFRKWYGNIENILAYNEKNRLLMESFKGHRHQNKEYYFKESLTWSAISSSKFGIRYAENGGIFGAGGVNLFSEKVDIFELLAYLSSRVAKYYLDMLNPSLNINVSDIERLPYIESSNVRQYAKENIEIARKDWNSIETSWGFKKLEIISPLNTSKLLEDIYERIIWQKDTQYKLMLDNEKKINDIYLEKFNLQGLENNSEIEITLFEVSQILECKKILSYFIGCLLGRYSLDKEGLVYAGGEWDNSKYQTFKPIKKGIVHFTEKAYFENDIILRLREFLAVAFSLDTVDENMQWLAETLEMKKGEDAEMRLRRYFMDEFFIDHCKMYQKRPIYWLVDSGKQKGLRILIYMHRYQPDTLATIRFEHLQEIQAKYQNEITDLENRLVNPNLSASEKKKLTAEKTSFEKKMDELREFDKRLAELANEEIEIDLDDGVKVNYEKFYRGGKGVLAKIK
ncbi:BREX-1 system adenine-specific DNA-methyltransferase PglX [Heyndrickxia vini]|uniref:site-specific DNA-methyltransferase (adenine-specific) n=1 Tax=Heyndrickxia vini TaxID=1476025 RepID=A0ABX7DZZ2_9BACI|nr:BREX-1 system adenine-specific DNA-methyltransferase PglX [Heyndrickxia vini]QQZ09061.1 BREX-1 system adenine-specific DNA-methyltransferase PglX [Heyndrickxia vini]